MRPWDTAHVHRPQNVAAGPGLSLRHAGPFGRSAARTGRPRRLRSRRHDRRSGVPVGEQDVLPLAEPGEPVGSGLVDAEDVQRHHARWRPGVRGPAEPVLSSAVLDHDHAKTIVSEDTVQPSVGQIKECEQSGPRHTASVQLVQHLQGERRHAVQRGKHMDRAPPRSLQSVLVGTKPGGGLHFDFCAVSDERGSRAMVPRARRTSFSTAGGERISSGTDDHGFPLRATAVAEIDEGSDGPWPAGRAGSLWLLRRPGLPSPSLSMRRTDSTFGGPTLAALDGLDCFLISSARGACESRQRRPA